MAIVIRRRHVCMTTFAGAKLRSYSIFGMNFLIRRPRTSKARFSPFMILEILESKPKMSCTQRLEQRLGFDQIFRVEAFGKLVVHRLQQIERFVALAL
jgi:hypothetical protein